MPDITIVKLKIRRGSNAQRQSVILEQGELGYATDTKRVFVGDGVVLGGTTVGNIAHPPGGTTNYRLTLSNAVIGDIVRDQKVLYQLTSSNPSLSSSWTTLSPATDNLTLAYNTNNELNIENNGITGIKFASTAAYYQGGLVATMNNGLSADVDNSSIVLNAYNNYKLAVGVLNNTHISSSVFGKGLEGGSGSTVQVNEDPSFFGYNGSNQLTLTALPVGIVNTAALSSNSIGAGLSISSDKLISTLQSVDNTTLQLASGVVSLKSVIPASTTAFENVTFNTYGQILSTSSVVFENLSGKNTGTAALFNGHIDQDTYSNQSLITAMSADDPNNPVVWATVTLSSAGFMTLATTMGRVAIPIFSY
jgi:hypothetical protein